MLKNTLSFCGGFLGPDGMGNLAAEYFDLSAIGLPKQVGNFLGKVGAAVHHRHENAVNLKPGIDLSFHLADSLQQKLQTFGREVFCLHRNENPVGGGQRIDGQHAQGGRTVDENVGVIRFDGIQVLPQNRLPAHSGHQGYLEGGKIDTGGNQVNTLRMVEDALTGTDWLVVEDAAQSGGYSKRQLVRSGMSQTDGQAALWVCINEQDFLSLLCQGDAQVDTGGGFANAAFLVDDGDNLLSLEYSWNYERQQNMGYCFAMLPAIKKIYQKKEDQIAAAKRHMEFFNTTPYISTAVFGISTAMEESNARNEDFDTSSINNVKVALMGPLAGIGDSMFWGTLRVIATGIGTSLAMQGSILGPLLFWLIFNVPAFAVRYICLKFGYKFGTSFLNKIEESGMMPKLTFGAAVLGLMVIGAMIPSMITVNIVGAIGSGDAAVKVQEILDGIMPNLVPFAMTLGIYGLLQKKVKVSWILIVLMVVGIAGALLGIF